MHNDGYDQGKGNGQNGHDAARAYAQDQAQKNKPVETLRDGNLKASIWRNQGESGPYYSTTFARTWRDNQGNYHDSHSFSGTDLLKLQELSRQAYTRTGELRREHMQEYAQTQQNRQAQNPDKTAFQERRTGHAQNNTQHRQR